MKKEITCITCPIGCVITVEGDGDKIISLTGNQCKRGITYAENEFLNPKRILTTSIKVNHGKKPLVSVRSNEPLPKEQIFQYMEEIKKKVVEAPVQIGDVLIDNIGGENVNIIATTFVDAIN